MEMKETIVKLGTTTITDSSRAPGDKILIAFSLGDDTLDTSSNFGGSLNNDTAIYYNDDFIAVVLERTNLNESDFYELGYEYYYILLLDLEFRIHCLLRSLTDQRWYG